jgi:hypothetical protein
MRNLLELQNVTDAETALLLIDKWTRESKNEELHTLKDCLIRMVIYANSLEQERMTFDRLIDQSRSETHRAVLRARKADESIQVLDNQIKGLKQSLEAFGL